MGDVRKAAIPITGQAGAGQTEPGHHPTDFSSIAVKVMRPRDGASYSLSQPLTATLQTAYHNPATTLGEILSASLRGSQRVSEGEEGWEGGHGGGEKALVAGSWEYEPPD